MVAVVPDLNQPKAHVNVQKRVGNPKNRTAQTEHKTSAMRDLFFQLQKHTLRVFIEFGEGRCPDLTGHLVT